MGDIIKTYDVSGIDTGITGMVFDGHSFWFAASQNKIIFKTDKSFNLIKSHDVSGIDPFPRGLAFDGKYFYMSGANNNNIDKLDMSINVMKSVNLGRHWGMTFNGKHLVTNRYLTGEIYFYDPLFNVIRIIPSLGLSNPRGLTFDGKNYWMSTSSNNITKYDSDFNKLDSFTIGSGLSFPTIAFADKYLYLSEETSKEIIQYAL